MFKKRTRPAAVRKVDKEADEVGAAADIDELVLLRRLRKSKQGMDLERFNRGDTKVVKGEVEGGYGLKSGKEDRDEFEDDMQRMMRMVKSNNFTQQTNVLDADKHMLDYIEKEMAKRRGGLQDAAPVDETFDPYEELYKMANKYKWDAEKKLEDGNVTNSMGMLTSIPEIDLGMENRLRNIEATERAKRAMELEREAVVKRRPEDEDFAAARYHRPALRIASDIYAANDQREAAGVQPPAHKGPETATDAEVYDRFKKRMKR